MKVHELIEMLKDVENQNAEVRFQYPSGDYWKALIAQKIDEVEMAYVQRSEYHMKDVVIETDEDIDDEAQPVIILK